MLNYRRNQLFMEGVSLDLLARSFGTPLYVYSKDRILKNYRAFDDAFKSVPHLVCYASKANSNFTILKTLAEAGAGADITSGGELYRVLRAGFPADRVVYAGIGKTQEEIEYALKENILMFNVESMDELEQINAVAKRFRTKARISFRVNPNVDPHTHQYITTGKIGGKFGVPYTEAIKAYHTAVSLPNIEPVGIHCHIGSQITSPEPFKLAAERIAGIVRRLTGMKVKLKYVNVGGGLGIKYEEDVPPTPQELSAAVLPALKKGFNGTVVLEPGRSIVGDAGVMVAKVVYRKKSGGKSFFIVDGAMNDLMRPTLYDAYHEIVPVKNPSRQQVKVDVVGPICESGDFLGKERQLPDLPRGEFIVVKNAGAYGFAMSSQYNSRLRAAEVMVEGKEFYLIRRRERYADLVANEL